MAKSRSRGSGEGTIYKKEIAKTNKKTGKDYKLTYYEAQITLGYDDTGKQKRKSFSGKTRLEVSERMKVELAKQQKGQLVETNKITFGDYLNEWLVVKDSKLKKSTLTTYKLYISLHIKPSLGNIPIQKLTTAQVHQFYTDKSKSDLNPKTVHRFHAIIHNALKHACINGIVPLNVSDNAKSFLPKTIDKKMEFLTVEETQRLLEVAKNYGIKKNGEEDVKCNKSIFPAIMLAVYTGLRRAELVGLKWKYVDLAEMSITVAETLLQTNDGIYEDKPKTERSKRTISIPIEVVDVLTKHKERTGKFEYVFTANDGTPIQPRNFNRAFDSLVSKAGITKDVRLHDLRHTNATLLISQNVNAKVIQHRLGHANISTTMDIYGHVMEETEKKSAEKLSELLKKK